MQHRHGDNATAAQVPRTGRCAPADPSSRAFPAGLAGRLPPVAEQARRLLALGIRADDEAVVCDRGDGKPIDPSTFTHAASRLAVSAGFDGARLHDVRHRVATLLAESGNRPELTSKLLGHSSVAFTLQTYTHPDDDAMDAVGDMIGRALA
jgi:integrase